MAYGGTARVWTDVLKDVAETLAKAGEGKKPSLSSAKLRLDTLLRKHCKQDAEKEENAGDDTPTGAGVLVARLLSQRSPNERWLGPVMYAPARR